MITPTASCLGASKAGPATTVRSAGSREAFFRLKTRLHPSNWRRLAGHPVPGDPATKLSVTAKVTARSLKAPVVSVRATVIVSSGAQVGPLAVSPEGVTAGLDAAAGRSGAQHAGFLVVRALHGAPHQARRLGAELCGAPHLPLPKFLALTLDPLSLEALLLALQAQEFQSLTLQLLAFHAQALPLALNAERLLALPALELTLAE